MNILYKTSEPLHHSVLRFQSFPFETRNGQAEGSWRISECASLMCFGFLTIHCESLTFVPFNELTLLPIRIPCRLLPFAHLLGVCANLTRRENEVHTSSLPTHVRTFRMKVLTRISATWYVVLILGVYYTRMVLNCSYFLSVTHVWIGIKCLAYSAQLENRFRVAIAIVARDHF